jgi:putative Mg2+ transporter-C (MgtC) family protein
MSTDLGWPEVGLRLTLTVLAGLVVGLDRERRGRPAGLRTTVLVCLAASVSMIQANLLLPTNGKTDGSFATLDLMRLPLGILTGMGFIGAGAILKKNDIVVGITTAATLWFTTVIGLCFGGGQIALGIASLAIGVVVLRTFKSLEHLLRQEQTASLTVSGTASVSPEQEIRAALLADGFNVASPRVRYDRDQAKWTLTCEVRWWSPHTDAPSPPVVEALSRRAGICVVEWTPIGKTGGAFD